MSDTATQAVKPEEEEKKHTFYGAQLESLTAADSEYQTQMMHKKISLLSKAIGEVFALYPDLNVIGLSYEYNVYDDNNYYNRIDLDPREILLNDQSIYGQKIAESDLPVWHIEAAETLHDIFIKFKYEDYFEWLIDNTVGGFDSNSGELLEMNREDFIDLPEIKLQNKVSDKELVEYYKNYKDAVKNNTNLPKFPVENAVQKDEHGRLYMMTYLVVAKSYEYNDNDYTLQDGYFPEDTFLTLEEADATCRKRNLEEFRSHTTSLYEYIDEYDDDMINSFVSAVGLAIGKDLENYGRYQASQEINKNYWTDDQWKIFMDNCNLEFYTVLTNKLYL